MQTRQRSDLDQLDDLDDLVTPPGDAPVDDGLTAVAAAMRQLQDLIDDYLGDSAPPRSAPGNPQPLPSPPTSTEEAEDIGAAIGAATGESDTGESDTGESDTGESDAGESDAGGWGRALAVRSKGDPQLGWIEANAALRRGEHARAFELFEAEAEVAAGAGDHPRAAIAYRMASDAAAAMGRRDRSDHDLRLAGKNYLFVAEDPNSSLQAMYAAFLAASRCFLAVGNLELTQSCVSRALDLQDAMKEDLHSRFNGPARQPQ